MAEIDLALVQLSQQYPRQIFIQKGDPCYGIQWTSTCIDQPARWPIHTETKWTPMLHASIAQDYAKLQSSSTECHKQIVWRVGELYGRKKSTVATALASFSSIWRST